MERDKIFFATGKEPEQLTSTSAQTVCNLAKEYVRTTKTILNSIRFYTTSIGLVGGTSQDVISNGIDESTFDNIPQYLDLISQADSLIAWLKEAIKAKERLAVEVRNLTVQEVCAILNMEYPDPVKMEMPTRGHVLTEDEYWGSKSVQVRNKYYELDTYVKKLGKFIHEDGAYAQAKEDLTKKVVAPHSLSGSGRDTILYHHIPTIDPADVEDMYFALQQKHREAQKHLNKMVAECTNAIEESQSAVDLQYFEEIGKYNAEFATAEKLRNQKIAECEAAYTNYVRTALEKVRALKIIIPESLMSIYKTVSLLGKENKGE